MGTEKSESRAITNTVPVLKISNYKNIKLQKLLGPYQKL